MSAPMLAPDDWRTLALGSGGRSLIEASAGTGKTWTITVLYLRLLLERQLSPRQIVVTTFTDAAAGELRERLRSRLLWAEARASAPHGDGQFAIGDIDGEWLAERWQHDDGTQQLADLQRLRVGLAELDRAPITTLHGLCQRILSDHPFASGALFVGADLVSGDALVAGIARDLLRRLDQGGDDDVLFTLMHECGVDLSQSLPKILGLLLMPGSRVHCLSDAQIREALPPSWSARLHALCAQPAWFTANASLRKHWLALAGVIDAPLAPMPTRHFDTALAKASALAGLSAAGKRAPEAIAAGAFAESVAASGIIEYLRSHALRRFWCEVAAWARQQVAARLSSLDQRSFDDLLTSVHAALQGDRGAILADLLHDAWPVALVDEFQDTDGVQYGILDRIYRDAAGMQRGRLVLIGDPKQAIYRFRGGDIQAYRRAAEQVLAADRISLDTNRRSSVGYVAAVNQFFDVAGAQLRAEGVDDIHYQPVLATTRHADAPYRIDGRVVTAPLLIHYEAQCPPGSAERQRRALAVCADQIAEAVHSGRHRFGERSLVPADIAVLLPANHHVDKLRTLLRERGVPCVTTTRASVFGTDTARDLLVLLHAVANASTLDCLRAALATRLWGADYAQLLELGDDSMRWQQIALQFHAWGSLWQKRGVLAVVDAVIAHVAARQLDASNGERVLTDLRHLGELLQEQTPLFGGVEELLAWFNRQREAGEDESEAAADNCQLRIESDSGRVRLMTLHASKGLEFNIVFLPLMWAHGERDGCGLFQVPGPEGERVLDLGDDAKKRERADLQDERFRILYVALTRAVHACHLFALPPDRPAKKGGGAATGTARSALDVMLERMQPPRRDPALAARAQQVAWIEGWHAPRAWPAAALASAPALRVVRSLPAPAPGPVPARHSFTTLTRDATLALAASVSAEDEGDVGDAPALPALDAGTREDVSAAAQPALPAVNEAPHPTLLELESVKGKDFGNAVHAMFEHRMPGLPFQAQSSLVLQQFSRFNVRCRNGRDSAVLAEVLSRRLQGVLDASLGASASHVSLSQLAHADLRAEMEFNFPLQGTSMARLRAACERHGEHGLVPGQDRRLAGLMNGKIDLVFRHEGRFHVLDYKGNFLGTRLSDYRGAALLASMDASDYRFQALLYCAALDRYLQQRLRGYRRALHLGHCHYVFIRAFGLQEDVGVWQQRFSDELIDAVQQALCAADVGPVIAEPALLP